MPLKLQDTAPDFTLPSVNDTTFTLSKNMANKPCILYFYPKNFTNTCTAQACEFRNHFDEFRELDVAVVGISQDDVASHKKFKKAYDLPFELLADEKGEVLKKYDADIPLLGGLTGMSRRVTYLLDASHQIVAMYEGLFESKEHVEEMLKILKQKTQ